MYGDTVRWFHDPGVADISACNSWRALARQGFASTVGLRPGPSHINLPFREPLVGKAVEVPQDPAKLSQFVGRPLLTNSEYELVVTQLSHESGVIVAGKGCGDSAKVSQLANRLGWPVLADSRSGCQGIPEAVIYFDSILRHQAFSGSHQPQAFLRLGEAPSSKMLSQFISESSAVQIHVGQFDDPFDADHKVSSHITCDPSSFCEALISLIHPTTKVLYLNQWLKADELAEASIAKYQEESVGSLSGPTVSRIVAESLKTSQNLVVSSSMPVRDLEWFGGDCSRFQVFSNRGANGIDGVVATAIGVAIATDRPTVVLIGDVALLHDSSSLVSLTSREVEVKIVVTDNDGGAIFHYLAQSSLVATEKFEKLFGTPHGSDLVRLAEAHQITTFECRTSSELRDALARSGTCLIRIATDRHNEVLVHQEINTKVAFALDQV
jgi:2-succinyl-5-enolpyruvyl-6-hydroxy-3-cyclohexene-1-carboxylate synthase